MSSTEEINKLKRNPAGGKKKGLSREERAEQFGYPKRKQPADVGAAALGRQRGKPDLEKNENMDQDVTHPYPEEMYLQADQEIKGFAMGSRKAIKGFKYGGLK